MRPLVGAVYAVYPAPREVPPLTVKSDPGLFVPIPTSPVVEMRIFSPPLYDGAKTIGVLSVPSANAPALSENIPVPSIPT